MEKNFGHLFEKNPKSVFFNAVLSDNDLVALLSVASKNGYVRVGSLDFCDRHFFLFHSESYEKECQQKAKFRRVAFLVAFLFLVAIWATSGSTNRSLILVSTDDQGIVYETKINSLSVSVDNGKQTTSISESGGIKGILQNRSSLASNIDKSSVKNEITIPPLSGVVKTKKPFLLKEITVVKSFPFRKERTERVIKYY